VNKVFAGKIGFGEEGGEIEYFDLMVSMIFASV